MAANAYFLIASEAAEAAWRKYHRAVDAHSALIRSDLPNTQETVDKLHASQDKVAELLEAAEEADQERERARHK